ncbi:cytidyltransferase [Solibacillus sp. R5-41]|uniref:acylneuraminate cytidylyltransferase family protein n=1 Tax=Solibacillus sp. R5-41 TaxID=2048654 RepID=UPI000C126B4F|nr:acylneuraminate cytidylyltransferase family protein [Solibacillus sp. R5-41]ATP39080.1 cytidyltransferase [Solibacillus sp. R5-41]
MINQKKVLALIPARGGSKSIPKKNIVELYGKPLISWTIEAAINTPEIDKVIVSTDSIEIAQVALEYGAEIQMRPAELAEDSSLVIDTIHYVLKELEKKGEWYDFVTLLEPTAPLRTSEDISSCIRLLCEKSLDSTATFKEADLNPIRAWKIEGNVPTTFIEGAIPWLPRQELPTAHQLNGAVYVTKVEKLLESKKEIIMGNIGAVIMPKERSVDIDDRIDLLMADFIMKKKFEDKE